MNKPKILIFIDWFAPGYKAGGPTTSNVNIVEHLKDVFDFYVVTSDTDYHEFKPYPGIHSDKWTEKNGVHMYYFSRGNLSFQALKKTVEETGCDTWYVNGIYSKYFSIYPLMLAKQLKPKRVIVSARGMLSPHALAIKSVVKKSYLFAARMLGLFSSVKFHATNTEEAGYIKRLLGKGVEIYPIENLPRKVSIDFFPTKKEQHEVRLVSFARISPEKNTLFAVQCLKYCRQRIIYHIYGQINSKNYWEECKQEIESLPENVTVEYEGTVSPDEMPRIYHGYHFLYLPSTGENFGHAILESLTNSSPVIISDRTPWKHLNNKKVGWDLPLDDPHLFAATIDKCAKLSLEKYEAMALNAYEYGKERSEGTPAKQKYISLFTI